MKRIFALLILLSLSMRNVSAFNFPDRADLVTSTGYATIHVNQNAYRWNAISSVTISATVYQAMAYWNSSSQLVIATRVLDGAWTEYAQAGITVPGNDNHDVCTIGIDPDGYIHVAYAMHNDALVYRKSDSAIDSWTGTLTTTLSMVGTNETSVSYPTFINDPAGNLYFLFRDGGSGNGDLYMYKYTHGTTTWAGVTGTTAGKLIDGKNESPTRNPYWDHPVFDSDFGSGGYMHLSWHWRVTGDTSGYNRDVSYVKWDGTNWVQADDTSQTVPITSANAEVVDNTSGENAGLTGFNSLYSDSSGNPHIVYPKTATSRYLFHAYHNGTSWTVSQLPTQANPNYSDNSTFDIGLTPAIAIDRSTDTVYVIYRDLFEGGGIWLLKSSDFSNWTKKRIYPYSVGWLLPRFDYVEFERSGVLYIPIEQYHGALLAGSQSAFPIYLWKVDPSIW